MYPPGEPLALLWAGRIGCAPLAVESIFSSLRVKGQEDRKCKKQVHSVMQLAKVTYLKRWKTSKRTDSWPVLNLPLSQKTFSTSLMPDDSVVIAVTLYLSRLSNQIFSTRISYCSLKIIIKLPQCLELCQTSYKALYRHRMRFTVSQQQNYFPACNAA